MKRAISIVVLAAFAAACFIVVDFYSNPQGASAETILKGSAHYNPNCQWQEKQDRVNLWNDDRTQIIGSNYINAPPTGYYQIWGDFGNDWYWVQGITYHIYWEDWHHIYIDYGEINYQDVYFCFEDTPDR